MPSSRILVAEDCPQTSRQVIDTLAASGINYGVRVAPFAIISATITSWRPEVVIVTTPSGQAASPGVLQLLRTRADLTIVVVAAALDRKDETVLFEAGAWDVMTGDQPARLMACLRRRLGGGQPSKAATGTSHPSAKSRSSVAAPAVRPIDLQHELNNQLGIIRMLADYISISTGLPPNCAAKAAEIVSAAERATKIVRRFAQSAETASNS